MALALSLRDRFALVARAISGSLPTDPHTVGGRLVAGVINPGGYPPSRGTREQIASYSTMPWLRAVVSRISYDVGAVRWELYIKRKEGKPVRDERMQRASSVERRKMIQGAIDTGEMDAIDSHPALDLIHNANSFHTGLAIRRLTQQHLDLSGEAFWLYERDGMGMPIAIWPVVPSWVIGTPTLSRPVYRVSFKGWQGEIPATEMVWFCDLDPANPYARGSGTAQSLADELETDEFAAKHVKAFYFNRARPDLVVSPKDSEIGMQEDEVKRLEEGWNARAGGFWRAFKPFFLRRAVDIKELDQNFRAQQFIQLREFERNTILQCFGVSPEILGIVGQGANRATITMAEFIYSRRVLVPRLELMRSVMQERLIPEFDERLVLDYVSPVAKDSELELEAAKAAPFALTIDEWRERMGEEPLPDENGSEIHMVPSQYMPIQFGPDLVAQLEEERERDRQRFENEMNPHEPKPLEPGDDDEQPLEPGQQAQPPQERSWDSRLLLK